MEPLHLLLIVVVVAAAAGAFAFQFVRKAQAERLKQQARELEVQIRMSSGMQAVDGLRALSKLYLSAGDLYTADRHLDKAVKLAEGVLGTANPDLLPVLSEHLELMERMKRRREANKLKERIKGISRR